MTTHIRIIAVGKIKESYIREGIAEYVKRLTPFCKLEIVELKDMGIEKETDRLAEYGDAYLLDPLGKEYTSPGFAEFLKKQDRSITFLVGGADGVNDSLKKKVPLISLSKMTIPHELFRLVFLEQIYRAMMINANRKYHR